MEMSQGNFLCSYLKQTKCHFTKSENERAKQVPVWEDQWEVGGCGERVKEDEYVQILCTNICRWKNETC
jgi:hypothetical protein